MIDKKECKCVTCNGVGWWWSGCDPAIQIYCYECDGKGVIIKQ